jgi:Family of unknown function (DUF6152)
MDSSKAVRFAVFLRRSAVSTVGRRLGVQGRTFEHTDWREGAKMRVKLQGPLLSVAVLFFTAIPAFAHHAFEAEFTESKPISITGVVTKVDWVNPHAYVYLDVKDGSGKIVNWSFETLPPGMLHRAGMERDLIPVGQTITIDGYGAKDDGKSLGWIKRIHFQDGRTIEVTKDNGDNSK